MVLNIISDLSSIFIDKNTPLGVNELNKKFEFLIKNDVEISKLFSAPIGIWQCSWYYDSNIKGYSLGDAVWLNTEDPVEFVKSKAGLIKDYTDLNSSVLTKLPEFDAGDDSVIAQYYSAMTGYIDPSIGKDVVLPPIFEIGDYSKPVQLLVSLKNNNKALLNDETAWKKLFINSDNDLEQIRNLIKDFEGQTLKEHLSAYHLIDCEHEVAAKLSDYLDFPSEEREFPYNALHEEWYSKQRSNLTCGVDYVTYFIRKPYMVSGVVAQYQAVRYWKSGLMEHFGTIATNNKAFVSDSGNELIVSFDWKIANDSSGAKTYISGKLANGLNELLSAYETSYAMIPPKDNLINVVYEKENFMVNGSQHVKPFANNLYVLAIHPIFQSLAGITDNYIPISYGEQEFEQNWNANYLTNEVCDKNRSFFTMRLKTRVVPPFISYYAIGKGEL